MELNNFKEYGPNQFILETVITKNSEKIEYEKKSVETLVKYCGKEGGLYQVPQELLTSGEIENFISSSGSGINPGEIKVLEFGFILFEIPYKRFEGFVDIWCWPDSVSGDQTIANLYTTENEDEIIRDNIQRLYDEVISIEYIDCRRNMSGTKIGDEVIWRPNNEGSYADIWNTELCSILDI